MSYRRVPLLLWPFAAIWELVGMVLKLTGRFAAVILGIVFIMVGIALTLTVVGAIVGIPLAALGFTLMVRGFF